MRRLRFVARALDCCYKMALEDEDSYQNSSWANPKALKSAFSGVGDVKWRGGM